MNISHVSIKRFDKETHTTVTFKDILNQADKMIIVICLAHVRSCDEDFQAA